MPRAALRTEEVADRLHSAAIRLLRAVRKEDAASGISGAQLSALSVLVFGGAQTLGSLAAIEQVKPPTMSQLVGALEAQGLVVRRPLDRRSIEVTVTDKGRRLMEAGRKRRLARLARSLEGLAPSKLALLDEAARIILASADRAA